VYNIVIIGAGQIGSRHLQAIAKLEGNARVHLVDPSEESLRVAQERFFQVYERGPEEVELVCNRCVDTVPDSVDLAIVATCSNIRAAVVKELVGKKQVENFILEKVLFQKEAEYYEIEELLEKKNIPAWVNCYLRSRDFYQKLRGKIDPDQKVEMRVEGSLWGMGCNSIHFIDYFAYLTSCPDFSFTASRLDPHLVDSKRPGFMEFSGELTGKNSRGHTLILKCRDQGNDPIKITINNGSWNHEIVDRIDHVMYSVSGGGHKTEQKASIPFQSQTTNRLVQQIRDYGDCDLTPYRDSMNLHLPLIKTFLEHIQNLSGRSEEICPIT